MRKGQTSIRKGIQDVLCPFTELYITQGAGAFSHKGTEAIDVRGSVIGAKAAYYAPCDLRVVYIYEGSATVMWQSINKVRLANGKVDYITIVTAHDDTVNFKVGFTVKQGVQMGNMGVKGIGTGVHAHIEQGYGQQTLWSKNGHQFTLNGQTHDIWALKKQIPFEDVYFMDNTNIISGKAKWKYLRDVPVSEYNLKDKGRFSFGNTTPIKVRNGRDGLKGLDTGARYLKGHTVRYDGVYEKDGYVWLTYISSTNVRRSVAVGKDGKLWGNNI